MTDDKNSTLHRPWRSLETSAGGFEITFHRNTIAPESEFCINLSFLVHSPYQIISHLNYDFFTGLRYGIFVDVNIIPEVLRPHKSLRNLEPQKRQCFFHDEKKLKYFTNYNKINCVIECFSDVAYENCGCLPFNNIRNKTMKVCDLSSWKCVLSYEKLLSDESFQANQGCNCLPDCDSTKYHIEVHHSRTSTNYSEKFVKVNDFELFIKINLSFTALKIYHQFLSSSSTAAFCR